MLSRINKALSLAKKVNYISSIKVYFTNSIQSAISESLL